MDQRRVLAVVKDSFSARELDPRYDIEDFLAAGSIPDLTTCDREPIHLSGAIQPHGVLLALDADMTIQVASANAGPVLGMQTEALLGSPVTDWLSAHSAAGLLDALADGSGAAFEPLEVDTSTGKSFDLTWHRMKDQVVLELESTEASPQPVAVLMRNVNRALTTLQAAPDVQSLCEAAATHLRLLTGYDRVMVYRFHPDWHGEVVAEDHVADMIPFLDHHYPASDIPRQARKLYQLNHLRVIADAGYQPVPLWGAAGIEHGELNLSLSGLRSVSPIHLQYLQNMGVQATLTLSLMDHTDLWGMISCHHRTPKRLDARTRASCRILGQAVGIGVATLAERDRRAHRERLGGDRQLIVGAMADAASLTVGLVGAERSPLHLTAADGLIALIDGQRVTAGTVPPDHLVDSILDSLHADHCAELVCDDLPVRFPAIDVGHQSCGVLALLLSEDSPDFLMWFRREWVHTLTWGGNPDKPMTDGPPVDGRPSAPTLQPRVSFDSWLQEVRGRSRPWLPAEVDTARTLALSITDLQLSRARTALISARDAERANIAKNEFLSRMSHELRTPLNAVLGFAQLLEMDDLNSEQEDAVSHILRGGRHLLGLIDDVLDISKIESDRLEMSVQLVPVSRLITETVELMAPMAAAAHLRLRYTASPASATAVRADHRRLRQVVLNLLSNAIKYNRPGGRVDVDCAVTADRHLDISVRDTGRGIRAEHVPRLFVPFDRLDAASSDIEGTGVGLALSYRLMALMDGTLSARSEFGVGSVFTASLPLAAESAMESGSVTGPLPDPDPDPDRPTVPARLMLYVEDNSSNIELMERVVALRPEWAMLVAGHGALGVELAASSTPDLMLLDLHLPDMDGIEVLRAVRSDPRTEELAIIVTSADASPHQIERLLDAGAGAYLTKPLVVTDLLALLDSASGRSRS